jgi:hypothetical protein
MFFELNSRKASVSLNSRYLYSLFLYICIKREREKELRCGAIHSTDDPCHGSFLHSQILNYRFESLKMIFIRNSICMKCYIFWIFLLFLKIDRKIHNWLGSFLAVCWDMNSTSLFIKLLILATMIQRLEYL